MPTAELRVHVTPVFVVPVTLAVNCCVWPALNVVLPGATVIATDGFTVIVALADLVGSAALVAIALTV